MTAQEFFNTTLPTIIAANAETVGNYDAVIRFVATGDGGGDWTVRLKNPSPSCAPFVDADSESLDATMTLAASDFPVYHSSPREAIQFFLKKKLVIEGSAQTKAINLRKTFTL